MKTKHNYSRYFGLKPTCFFSTCVLLLVFSLFPGRVKAQSPLWKIANTELRNDDRQLLVTFEPTTIDNDNQNGAIRKKMSVLIRGDNTLISYQPADAIPSECIVIDPANKDETLHLSEILLDFIKVYTTADGPKQPRIKTFNGTLGDFNVEYEYDYNFTAKERGPYGGYIKLISKDGDRQKYRAITEPTALQQVITSVESLRKMHLDAIQSKKTSIAAQKVLQEEKDKDEIAAARAAVDERVKNAEESTKAELARINQKKQLDLIAQEETLRKAHLQSQLLAGKRAKVSEYLASKEGQALDKTIQVKLRQLIAKETVEKAGLIELEQKMAGFLKIMQSSDPLLISSGARQNAIDNYVSTTIRLSEAKANFKDSPELAKMRKELRELAARFEADCGIPYDEAMQIQKELNQSTISNPMPEKKSNDK